MGLYSSQKKYVGWPCTPGFEYSGIVESIGDDIIDDSKEKGIVVGKNSLNVNFRDFANRNNT
jgi:NADPH:quinone reductase-like Zn-dependent oxidoreductase